MSDLCRNNGANNRLIDDWLISALTEFDLEESDLDLVESILMWWIGFGEPPDEEPAPTAVRISAEQTQRLRQQRLLLSALRAANPGSALEPEEASQDEPSKRGPTEG